MASGTVGTVSISYTGDDLCNIDITSFTFTYVGQTQTINYSGTTPTGASAASSYVTTFNSSISTGSGSSYPTHTLTQTRVAYTESVAVSPTSGYTTSNFTYTVTGAPGTTFYWYTSINATQTTATLSGSQGDASSGTSTFGPALYWITPGTYTVYVHFNTTGTDRNVSVTVTYPPLVVSSNQGTSLLGQVGSSFSGNNSSYYPTGYTNISATGGSGTGYTYAVTSGSLPPGLSLSGSGGTAGLITGTPTASNFYSATITATDSASTTGTISLSFAIVAAPAISSASLSSAPISGTDYLVGSAPTITWTSTGTSAVGITVTRSGYSASGQGSYGSNSSRSLTTDANYATNFPAGSYTVALTPVALAGVGVYGTDYSLTYTLYNRVSIDSWGVTTNVPPYNSSTSLSVSTKAGTDVYYNWTTSNATKLVYYINLNSAGYQGPNDISGNLQGPSGRQYVLISSAVTTTELIYITASNPASTATSNAASITWTPYNEVLTNSPTSFTYPNGTTLTITGGVPYDTFTWSVNTTAYDQPAISLDGNGSYTNTSAYATVAPGAYIFYAKFTATGHTRQTSQITISAPAPVISNVTVSSAYPSDTITVTFHTDVDINYLVATSDGGSGPYGGTIQNSNNHNHYFYITPQSAGSHSLVIYVKDSAYSVQGSYSTSYTVSNYPYGTAKTGQYCNGFTLQQDFWNGSGGTYTTVIRYNDVNTCGYVPPAATITIRAYGDTSNITIVWSTTNAGSTTWSNYISSTAASGSQYFNGAGGAFAGGSFSLTGTANANNGGSNGSKTINIGPINGAFDQTV